MLQYTRQLMKYAFAGYHHRTQGWISTKSLYTFDVLEFQGSMCHSVLAPAEYLLATLRSGIARLAQLNALPRSFLEVIPHTSCSIINLIGTFMIYFPFSPTHYGELKRSKNLPFSPNQAVFIFLNEICKPDIKESWEKLFQINCPASVISLCS